MKNVMRALVLCWAATRSRMLLGCAATVLVVACGPDPAATLAEAQQRFDAGDLRTASIHVSNLLQADANDGAAQFLRGRIALLAGDAAAARAALERARNLGIPDEVVTVPLSLAMVRSGAGGAATALELLERVPESSRDDEYWLAEGLALFAQRRIDDASAALDRSRDLGGETSQLLAARALISDARGEGELVGEWLNRAVDEARLPHEVGDALAMRGTYYQRLNRLADAATDLELASELYGRAYLNAKEVTVLVTLAQLYLTVDNSEGLRDVGARLAARAPELPVADYVEGVVAYRSGAYPDAIGKLQEAVSGAPDNPTFRRMLGAAHLAQGNTGQAEQQLRSSLAANPGDLAATKLLAEAYLRQGRFADALTALDAVAPDQRDAQVGLLQSRARLLSGDVANAVRQLEQTLSTNPGNQMLQLELARAYFLNGRDDAALEVLGGISSGDEALAASLMSFFAQLRSPDAAAGAARAKELVERFPQEARAHAAAAMFYVLSGDATSAESGFRTAVTLDRTLLPARLFLAGVLAQKGNTTEAERVLTETLEIAPSDPSVLVALAQLAAAKGDLSSAESYLVRASEMSASDVRIRYALGDIKLRLDQDAAAEEIAKALQRDFAGGYQGFLLEARIDLAAERYSDAADRLGDAFSRAPVWEILVQRVRSLRLAGRAADTEPLLADWLKAHPDQVDARLMLADGLQADGRDDRALTEYEQVLKSAPDNVMALNNAAWLKRERDPKQALAYAQRAAAQAPSNPGILDTLGWILTASNRTQEGIVHLKKAAELAPDSPDIQYHYGFALNTLGRKDEAREVLEAVLGKATPFAERSAAEALLASLR